jgi:transposase
MLALATTHDGDVPLFLQPGDGNRSDKVSLLAAIMAIQKQLREADAEPSVYVADNGIYSEQNMRQLNAAAIKWISRVSETSTEAKTVLQAGSQDWQRSEDGSIQRFCREMELPQGSERLSLLCAPQLQSSEHWLRCNGRSAMHRPVGTEVLASGHAPLCL